MDKNKPITLYEYGEWSAKVEKSNFTALEQQLIEIWKARKKEDGDDMLTESENEEVVKKNDFQPFLLLNHKKEIRARNWVGFIQNDEQLIEIYPKVFKKNTQSKETSLEEKGNMLQHVFFWLDYCNKQRFPHTQAGLETVNVDSFPELIIYLFASHLKEILEEKPLSIYQEVEERMQMPRGRLNFQRYINNSLVTGQWHQMECDYDPFVFDNAVNRVIKYCARLLEQQTRIDSNINLLREITFILDEVEDMSCSIYDVRQIKLNPFFEEYETALDYCKMILEQQIYSSESYEMNRWTMLLPMELLFEDFIAGFIKKYFSDEWNVEFQKGDMYVVNDPKAFKMKHDIFLEHKTSGKKIIIDTKYKIRTDDEQKEAKKGVTQSDIYQMITYAIKRDCKDVVLMYPCALDKVSEHDESFAVNHGKESNEQIKIHVVSVPFWCEGAFVKDRLKNALKEKMQNVL